MVSNGDTGYFDYGSNKNGWPAEVAQANRQLYIQQFMGYRAVEPITYSESIAAFLRKWRGDGGYIIANTSTLPGCEISTIEFLETHYTGCFQGILFPRNYCGTGPTTKADAILAARQAIYDIYDPEPQQEIPIIAIDDAMHHANDLHGAGATVFVPEYPWNRGLSDHPDIRVVPRSLGVVNTFIAVDGHLKQKVG